METKRLFYTILFSCIVVITSYANNTGTNHNDNSKRPNSKDVNQTTYNYKTYCNDRFGFCIEYPSKLYPQGESGSGDGQKFISKDSQTILMAYRDFRIYDRDELQESYYEDLKAANTVITYKKLGNNYYVISGYKNNKIFYQKSIIRGQGLCTAIIEYPESEKNYYNKVCENIFRTFK